MCKNATNDGQVLNICSDCATMDASGEPVAALTREQAQTLRRLFISAERVLTLALGESERMTERQWRERMRTG